MANFIFERVNNKVIGQLLLEKGVISQYQLDEALAYGNEKNMRLGEALKYLGMVSHDYITYALGEQFGLLPVQITPSMLDTELVSRFPADLLHKHKMVPFVEVGDEIIVLISDPQNVDGLQLLATYAPSKRITPQLGDASQIEACLAVFAPQPENPQKGQAMSDSTQPITPFNSEGPAPEPGAPNFSNWLLSLCLQSDDHDLVIRFDNRSTTIHSQPRQIADANLASLGNVYEFSGIFFTAILEELMDHCVPLAPSIGEVYRWRAPLRFAGSRYSVQMTLTQDLTGAALTLRAFRLLEIPENVSDLSGFVSMRRLTLALFDSTERMQEYITKTSLASQAPPLLILRSLSTILRGSTAYPEPFALPEQLATHFQPQVMFFDYPVSMDVLANLYLNVVSPPNIHVCVMAGTKQLEFGPSNNLKRLLEHDIFTVDFRENTWGAVMNPKTLLTKLKTGDKF